MAESKHTPGPWRALCLKSYTRVIRDSQGPGDETGSVQICHIAGPEESDLRPFNKTRWEADARLLAEAPELLELLKEGTTIFADDDGAKIMAWRRKARAAIAKAEEGK